MHEQCTNCFKPRKQCKCEKPCFECFTDPKDRQEAYKEADNKLFSFKKYGKHYKIEVLKHPIKSLRPITILENSLRVILVYLPTKTTIQGISEPQFENRAFFVMRKYNEKIIKPYDDPELRKNFKISVLEKYQPRWDSKNLEEWLKEKTDSEAKIPFELLYKLIKSKLDFQQEYDYLYFVLYNIGTYFFEIFDTYPYNDFTGTKRAGKTKALELQRQVCFNPIMSADISNSSIFRLIEGLGATLLLDETEQFKNYKNESAQAVRTLLNQGFLKDQQAIRTEGKASEGFTPVQYNVYSPKSLAHISSFDDVLEDRCIPLIMRRSMNPQILNSWIDERDPVYAKIRSQCYRLFLDYGEEVYNLKEEARNLISTNGREQKLWLPIVSLALFFQNHGINGLVSSIQTKIKHSQESRQLFDEESSVDLQVVKFLDEIMVNETKENDGFITITKLYQRLSDVQETYGINTQWYKRKKLHDTLRRLGLKFTRKPEGNSWLISRVEIDEVKKIMGMVLPTQTTLENTAFTAKTTETTLSCLDDVNKNVVNVENAGNVAKIEGQTIQNNPAENVTNAVSKNTKTTETTEAAGEKGHEL